MADDTYGHALVEHRSGEQIDDTDDWLRMRQGHAPNHVKIVGDHVTSVGIPKMKNPIKIEKV